MDYVHVFRHVEAVAARAPVYLMAAVIGAKTYHCAMVPPVSLDLRDQLGICLYVFA